LLPQGADVDGGAGDHAASTICQSHIRQECVSRDLLLYHLLDGLREGLQDFQVLLLLLLLLLLLQHLLLEALPVQLISVLLLCSLALHLLL
jgi:hypothetical protein